jgi:hypothetical protein
MLVPHVASQLDKLRALDSVPLADEDVAIVIQDHLGVERQAVLTWPDLVWSVDRFMTRRWLYDAG